MQRGRQQRRALAADKSPTAAADWMERQQFGSSATSTDDIAVNSGESGDAVVVEGGGGGGGGTPSAKSVPLENAIQRNSPPGILMATSANAGTGAPAYRRARSFACARVPGLSYFGLSLLCVVLWYPQRCILK